MTSLAPQDATRYWLSRRTVNDLFLLYCFDDAGASFESLRDEMLARAAGIPDLCVRLREYRFAYPRWVPCDVVGSQITEPAPAGSSWANVVAALEKLLSCGVRADECPWRLHVFRGVRGAPGGDGPALIAVLQLSHALADGRRAAEIARALWTDVHKSEPNSSERPESVAGSEMRVRSAVRGPLLVETAALLKLPIDMVRTMIRGLAADRARRELEELTLRGELPSPATDLPLTRINHPPAPSAHAIRMIVREDLRVPGYTVTVVAATAISQALSRYLADHSEPNVLLGAQVSMALRAAEVQPKRFAPRRPRNNYADLSIELPVREPDPRTRAARITADLAARRTRALHPLMTTRNAVTDVIPAPILRRDITTYPLDLTPETLSAHTVISSVNRGPATLTFATAPVRWTAGFPALGTVMHLTHGLHGLGNTVTISIHADPAVIPDLDTYANLLEAALTETVTALRS